MTQILILGAGPTGLGAAKRLTELGCEDWLLLEQSGHPGGLATSFVDERGFTWDVGGHIQFSHYDYFDNAMVEFLGAEGWLHHERESWVWMRDRFIPYPFQNNIRRLPREDLIRCLDGLVDLGKKQSQPPANFYEWIDAIFGEGIAEIFMRPYNFKVWAHSPKQMNSSWVGERVAVTDLKRVLRNLVFEKDELSWGPNNKFQFPLSGGTGAIWTACAHALPSERILLNTKVTGIDLARRTVTSEDGRQWKYDDLISTMPLTELIALSEQTQFREVVKTGLLYSSSNILGLGLHGAPPESLAKKCWMYFPEDNCPFYRATVFSNYSPNNVPDINKYWSLMVEVSESREKQVNHEKLLDQVIEGALNTHLIECRDQLASTWQFRARYGYPVPFLPITPTMSPFSISKLIAFSAKKLSVEQRLNGFCKVLMTISLRFVGRSLS